MTDLLEVQRTGLAILNARLDGDDKMVADLCTATSVTAGDLASLYLHVIVAAVENGAIKRSELTALALLLGAQEAPL